MILELIYKYLLLNKKISLSGIGSFYTLAQPATINPDTITPPYIVIQFQKDDTINNKQLFLFLAQQLHITELESIQRFNDFCHQLKLKLEMDKSITLPLMGKLMKPQSDIVFYPNTNSNPFYESLSHDDFLVTEIKRTKNTVASNRSWVWAALIIFLVSVGLIAFYFFYYKY